MTVTASLIALLLAASLRSSTVTGKLSAVVTPANSSADGSDWCQPLKPCNETKTNSAQIESIYGLGLLTKKTTASSTYQYADVTPATAVDWRTVLTNWTVRDQGTCGMFLLVAHAVDAITLLCQFNNRQGCNPLPTLLVIIKTVYTSTLHGCFNSLCISVLSVGSIPKGERMSQTQALHLACCVQAVSPVPAP